MEGYMTLSFMNERIRQNVNKYIIKDSSKVMSTYVLISLRCDVITCYGTFVVNKTAILYQGESKEL